MTDQPQPADAPVDDVEGHCKRAPFTQPDADDVAGHGRKSPIIPDDPAADAVGADNVVGRGRNFFHELDGPDDVEGHSARFNG